MEAHEYEADWEVYLCHIEDKPAFIGLDLNLRDIAPVKELTHVLEISVTLASPNQDGFPADSEWEALGEIEDRLVDKLEPALGGVFVGKTLNGGFRKFYFYTPDTLLHEFHVSEVMASFPAYGHDADLWEDPAWQTYFDFLYPEPEDMEKIQNGRLVRHIQEKGDVSSIPRSIEHFLYFRDAETREQVWEQAQEKGFQKTDESFDADLEETPYKLQVAKVAPADEETVNEMSLYLWQLAQQFTGEYDGWETSIETGDKQD